MSRGRRGYSQDEVALYLAVGRRFRNARKRAGLSQQQVAGMVGLNRTSVTNIEVGHQGLTLAMFLNFCDALSVEPADILGKVEL
jgi:DNA-binding XRE family transcriptional regulator